MDAELLLIIAAGLWVYYDYNRNRLNLSASTADVLMGGIITMFPFSLPEDVNAWIEYYAGIFGAQVPALSVPVDFTQLMKAQCWAESRGNRNARSSAGAVGLFQLMPATAAWLGVDENDPEQNCKGGIDFMSRLLRQYGGDVSLALAGYNAGSGNVRKYDGVPPFPETQNYIAKILGWLGVA